MPTDQQIHDEVTGDPASLGYASFVAGADWNGLADLMNAPTRRGPVPIRIVSAYCCSQGITGGVIALLEIPIGVSDNPPASLSVTTKAMLHNVLTLIQTDFRMETADVDNPLFAAACSGLVALGLMTDTQKAALLAMGANRIGRPCELWGYDDNDSPVSLTGEQIRIAMGVT